MRRYCETILHKFKSCDVGWGMFGNVSSKTCYSEPKEQNCHNLITEDNLHCPMCGQIIK